MKGRVLLALALGLALVLSTLPPPPPSAAQGTRTSWSLPADFSSTQGQNEWYYYRLSGSSYVQLVWDPYVNGLGYVGNCWSPQEGGGDSPRYLYIQGEPGKYVIVQPGEEEDAAIGWRAPRSGAVTVAAIMTAVSTDTTYDSWCAGCNDGIDLYIRHNATTVAGPARVLHGSPEFQSNSLSATIAVAQGDFIYFYVDRRTWQDEDAAYANFSITYEQTDRAWELYQPAEHVSNRLNGISAVSESDVWAVGSGGTILHYRVGMVNRVGVWSRVPCPLRTELRAIDMLSSTEGMAVDDAGHVLRYNGSTWESSAQLGGGVELWALDMVSGAEGWAAGEGTKIFHYSGGAWHQDAVSGVDRPGSKTIYGLHMLSPTDGWAVGSSGLILHYNGTSWESVTSPTTSTLRSVRMVAADEGWAVGDAGTILHYTAASGWQAANSPVQANLHALSMISRDEGWAAGGEGVLLHYNSGAGWHLHVGPTGYTVRAIHMLSALEGWAVGSAGTILHYYPAMRLSLRDRPTGYIMAGSPWFLLEVRDQQGNPITDATVTAELWNPYFTLWGVLNCPYDALGGYYCSYSVKSTDLPGPYSVQFRVRRQGYPDATLWSYFAVGDQWRISALVLTNFARMRALGYSEAELSELRQKVMDLAYGNPNGLGVIVELENVPAVANAYTAWASNPGDANANNAVVAAIDAEIERLRRDVYPNLSYVMIIGGSEVIPMYARDDDTTLAENDEDFYWSHRLDDTSYVHSLCYHGDNGRYLTDNVYADLAYLDSSRDHELTPELAVGRLVETPRQISRLIDDYLRLHGEIQAQAIVFASHDELDAGNAVFSGYPGGVDRSNVADSYSPANIPGLVSSGNVYVLAGHADHQSISAGSSDFVAGGCSRSEVGTHDIRTAAGSAMFTVACHAGVNLGDMLHNYPAPEDISCPPDATAMVYLEFPETWADLGMLAYAGSTSYAMGTNSGDYGSTLLVGGTEALVAEMTRAGRLVGRTVGEAFRDGMNYYWDSTEVCVDWTIVMLPLFGPFGICQQTGHTNYNRKSIGGYTLYGIPTLRVRGPAGSSGLGAMGEEQEEAAPTLQRQILSASATQMVEQLDVEVPTYRFHDGVVEIPGARQRVVPGEPYLPVLTAERTLPRGATVTDIAVDVERSTWVELDGHLAVPSLMSGNTPIPNSFSASDYYPAGLALAIDGLSLGGRGSTVGVSLIPVQYNPATGKIRIWTKVALRITYNVPDTGIAVSSLSADKGSYSPSESVALTANVSNAGEACSVDAWARLYNGRTGAALGERELRHGLTIPAGASTQALSLPLAGFGASLEGKQVRVELQLYDGTNGDLLGSGETTIVVADEAAPSAPVGLRAYPADRSVALSWQPCPEDDVWTYRVYWGTSQSSLGNIAEVPALAPQHTVSGLKNLATYYFAVAAVDLAGHEGARSQVVSAVPAVYCYLPLAMR